MTALVSFALLALFFSAFCSASEISFFSLSALERKQGEQTSKKLQLCLAHLPDVLILILAGNILANVAFSLAIEHLVIRIFEFFEYSELFKHSEEGLPLTLVGVGATLLLVLFGEMIPKNFAFTQRMALSKIIAYWWYGLMILFKPVTKLVSKWTFSWQKGLTHLINPQIHFDKSQEMNHLLALARRKGSLSEWEGNILQNIAKLQDQNARDIMTPRSEIKMLNQNLKPSLIEKEIKRHKQDHFPVYREKMDNVVGILDATQFLLMGGTVNQHINKASYAPETLRFFGLLAMFKDKPDKRILVVDEYGGITGLIEYLDLMEKIMGNLDPETIPSIHYLGKGHYRVSGDVSLEEIENSLHLDLSNYQSDTLNGLIHEVTGNLPQKGGQLSLSSLKVCVKETSKKQLLQAEIWKEKNHV